MSARTRSILAHARTSLRRLAVARGRARSGRSKRLGRRAQRRRIALWALLIGALAGLIELPMPIEDGFKAARAQLHLHPASNEIVVIEIDDRSLNELQVDLPDRKMDAAMIDQAFAAGIQRLVFDAAYADPTSPENDAAFVTALQRHPGKIWLGGSPATDNPLKSHAAVRPLEGFRAYAQMASMHGQAGPFGLALRLPVSSEVEGETIPSIAAVLAGYEGRDQWFRPDLSIDASTIQRISFIDVMEGRGTSILRNKSAVVAQTNIRSTDYQYIPLRGEVPGAYVHVMGGYTLQDGVPLDLSWYPALLLVAAVLCFQLRRKRPIKAVTFVTLAALPILATGFDLVRINIDIIPAMLALGIGVVRLHLLANRVYSRSTDLVLREALETNVDRDTTDVYALKITNLADFDSASSPKQLGLFVERVVQSLQNNPMSGIGDTQVAFEKDTLIWHAARLEQVERMQNAQGLMTLLRSGQGTSEGARIEGTLAMDVNGALPLQTRIHNAMQAAELGSRHSMRVVLADKGWLQEREQHVQLLSELDRAMRDGTIDVKYQPKIDLATGTIIGAEALLRWTHPQLGYIYPPDVIAVAEEHERIDELTVYVLARAMADAKRAIASDPSFKLAVNVSARTLTNPMLAYHFARLRLAHGVAGSNLLVEVTETVPLGDASMQPVVQALLSDGITFSIDDFGTGHSNLAYLSKVPSAEIKIDRSFVKDMLASSDSAAVVLSTIEMAHSLGKKVVAEGIENEATAEQLRRMGCNVGQGFLFAPAITMQELLPLLEQGRRAA